MRRLFRPARPLLRGCGRLKVPPGEKQEKEKGLEFEIECLQGLLKEEYWGNKVLLLPDVTFQDCTGFLELVYTGKVNIPNIA